MLAPIMAPSEDCGAPHESFGRAHDRLLRVARTIADLDHSANVAAKHLAEAVQFRNLDRNYWN
jgi:predicted ATPase with chaperone activity